MALRFSPSSSSLRFALVPTNAADARRSRDSASCSPTRPAASAPAPAARCVADGGPAPQSARAGARLVLADVLLGLLALERLRVRAHARVLAGLLVDEPARTAVALQNERPLLYKTDGRCFTKRTAALRWCKATERRGGGAAGRRGGGAAGRRGGGAAGARTTRRRLGLCTRARGRRAGLLHRTRSR